ncbi:MAG TPA: putative metal-dependent hydrolase [Chitinophagales bacterium]|nr:putative metal-dependent hydrolase [Chitinophagales bacterium]
MATGNANIYPIGKFKSPQPFNDEVLSSCIRDIADFSKQLKKSMKQLKKKDLQKTYKDGGWSIEQIIHHLADSHMNAYIRLKLALTENNPTVKPYDENLWAELNDIQLPLKHSVKILKGVHKHWATLLKNMTPDDFERTYFHPEQKKKVSIKDMTALYAWHGKHHLAQVEVARLYGE